MGNIISFVAAGLGWCFCTAAASLCTSCCGNDKASTVPPSATSGRRRSVLLLLVSIALAFAFQYGVAPALQPEGSNVSDIPGVGGYLVESWADGCSGYETAELRERCSGNAGVYRVAGATALFFVLAAIAAACKPTANREAWPAKYTLFIFLVAATLFIPNEPLFAPIYMNIARVGAVIFIFFQQIILIDLAYNLNESWVEKANKAEMEEGENAGRKWLGAILASCVLLFVVSIVVIVLLFVYFSGCRSNEAFISVTLTMSIIVTAVQLSGEEASLLTSAVLVVYASYLCLTAVSKNPNGECNPKLGDEDILGIILGVGFTLLSLAWTGWSFTAESKINGGGAGLENSLVENEHQSATRDDEDGKKVTGVVTNQNYGSGDEEAGGDDGTPDATTEKQSSNSWKLNIVLALVSCWFAMALTGWGAIEVGGNAANPDVGNVSMWMIITSQWLALALYLWTLVAPKLFPDRDFS